MNIKKALFCSVLLDTDKQGLPDNNDTALSSTLLEFRNLSNHPAAIMLDHRLRKGKGPGKYIQLQQVTGEMIVMQTFGLSEEGM